VAAASLAAAAVALAGNSINDPTGDLTGAALPAGAHASDVDITKASVGKANGKIEMMVRVDGSAKTLLSKAKTSPVFTVKEPGPQFYLVRKGPDGFDVYDTTNGGKPAPADVTKPDNHTVAVTFKPRAIGSPANYHWRVTTGYCVVYDGAPNTGFATNKSAKRC
jgi:hypothetical protein